jgi:ER lumen protein retaining receptor
MMKLSFIGATIYIIYLMKFSKPTCISSDRLSDDVPHYYVIPAALLLTAIIHTKWSFFEIAWSFSIWLEALAIIPQLRMITKL